MEEARKRGLLVGKGGFYGNVIRMSPPLEHLESGRGRGGADSG